MGAADVVRGRDSVCCAAQRGAAGCAENAVDCDNGVPAELQQAFDALRRRLEWSARCG